MKRRTAPLAEIRERNRAQCEHDAYFNRDTAEQETNQAATAQTLRRGNRLIRELQQVPPAPTPTRKSEVPAEPYSRVTQTFPGTSGPRIRKKPVEPQTRMRVVKPEPTDQEVAFTLRQQASEAKAKIYELCRSDVNSFCEFVLIDDNTGEPVEQTQFHLDIQNGLTKHRQIVIISHPECGKALSLTTPIPTPSGWKTMGELRVGDRVFGSDGKPCTVTFVTGVQLNHRVFDVEFEDGEVITADAEHRWLVRKRQALGTRVVTTADMLPRLRESDGHYVWSVPCAQAVEYERVRLPIDPYVLGAWLGDGNSANAGITFHENDCFVWDECVRAVGSSLAGPTVGRGRVQSATLGRNWGEVRGKLRKLGLLKNKHIPARYLRAGVADRRALLAGLLDTDGSVSRIAGGSSRIELTLCNQQLATDSLELIRSLGFRAAIAESDAVLNGRVVGRRWRITFTAREPVFRLPRKLAKQQLGGSNRTKWKHIVSIREVPSVPVRCIQVDSPDHTYLAGRGYTVTHNTGQIAVGRVLWELGRNPNLRIVLLYNSEDSAIKTLSTIRRYIETSDRLHAIFPNLKRGTVWKDDAIVVQRTTFSRDPSVSAVGYNSRRIQGSRIDFLVIDDLLDASNTATETQRLKLSRWLKNPVLNRLSDGAIVAMLANAWHPRDAANELVRERGWKLFKRPIRDPDGKIWWKRWSEARLALQRKALGALEYARSFECDSRDDGARVFRPEHVEMCLAAGKGYGFVNGLESVPAGCIVVTGVDVAAGDDTQIQSAKTVLTTVFFHPSGQRQVVRVRSGRWRATQIVGELALVGNLFPDQHWIVVETNNVQRWILDLSREQQINIGVPMVPFHTGRNKQDPIFGVASLAAEVEGLRWIFPSSCLSEEETAEIESLVSQLIDYVPEAHTGDHLMSMWLAREIGRQLFKRLFAKDSRKQTSKVRMIG